MNHTDKYTHTHTHTPHNIASPSSCEWSRNQPSGWKRSHGGGGAWWGSVWCLDRQHPNAGLSVEERSPHRLDRCVWLHLHCLSQYQSRGLMTEGKVVENFPQRNTNRCIASCSCNDLNHIISTKTTTFLPPLFFFTKCLCYEEVHLFAICYCVHNRQTGLRRCSWCC